MKSRLGRLLHGWIAAALAHRERQIEISVRRDPANRESKGVGGCRGRIARFLFRTNETDRRARHGSRMV
jgi:hypothetical protein